MTAAAQPTFDPLDVLGWIGLAVAAEHFFRDACAAFDEARAAGDEDVEADVIGALTRQVVDLDRALGHGFEPFEIPGGKFCGPFQFWDEGGPKHITLEMNLPDDAQLTYRLKHTP